MTKPRLGKVRALFYVLQQATEKEAAPILTQPLHLSQVIVLESIARPIDVVHVACRLERSVECERSFQRVRNVS